jgi:methyl-accepting chemotaxis protein/methyl-accepting chemotaxis protein-1 (serine sensor receptor)
VEKEIIMQWTIGKKLYSCTGLLVLVVVALIAGGMYSQRQLGQNTEEVSEKTAPNLKRAEEMRYLIATYRAVNRHNVILAAEKNAQGIEKNRKTEQDLGAQFAKVSEELGRNTSVEEVKALTRDAVATMKEYEGEVDKVTELAAAFRAAEAAQQMLVAAAAGDKAEAIGAKLGEIETARLKAVSEEGRGDERLGTTMLLTLGAIAFLALGIVGYVVRSLVQTLTGMVNNLKSGAEQVTSASTQVSASAQTLSQGSTEQAASLEETSASMEEMASMTRKNAENSQQAAHLMGEVDRVVGGSNKALGDMTISMASIGESSNKVAKIIKTIDEIAFQTNILALNAAVEAARAGEAGMGFAVVADEVRNLAQRSAQAAKDTAALIEESIAKSQEGQAKVTVVAQSIAAITDSVGKVKGLVTEVSEASRQQTQGIDQVAQAVSQMEKVTQSSAASAEESAAASEELNAQAESTMAEVTRLEAMVIGTRTGERVHHVPAREVGARPAGKPATLLKLSPKASAKAQPTTSAEDQIPLADTGTYGKF